MLRFALYAMDSRDEILENLRWTGAGGFIGFITGAIWGRYGWRRN